MFSSRKFLWKTNSLAQRTAGSFWKALLIMSFPQKQPPAWLRVCMEDAMQGHHTVLLQHVPCIKTFVSLDQDFFAPVLPCFFAQKGSAFCIQAWAGFHPCLCCRAASPRYANLLPTTAFLTHRPFSSSLSPETEMTEGELQREFQLIINSVSSSLV